MQWIWTYQRTINESKVDVSDEWSLSGDHKEDRRRRRLIFKGMGRVDRFSVISFLEGEKIANREDIESISNRRADRADWVWVTLESVELMERCWSRRSYEERQERRDRRENGDGEDGDRRPQQRGR